MKRYYKLAQPDGFDFYTGKTINYADAVGGGLVKPPHPDPTKPLCSSGLIHASDEPNKCFIGASIPCRAFIVEGKPEICDESKCGFVELKVVEEIDDLDELFGWSYTEACNPIHPLELPQVESNDEAIGLLRSWDSVWAYIGSLFQGITDWKYVEHRVGIYPYRPVVDLWKMGIVPSFDGEIWRLHSGEKADIIWKGELT